MRFLTGKVAIVWLPVLFYLAGVEIIVLVKNPALFIDPTFILNRFIFLMLFLISWFLSAKYPSKVSELLTIVLIYAGLAILYKETAQLNTLFSPPWDPILEQWDHRIFGFQPALLFSESFPEKIVSELLFFGYFSYYLMPLIILFAVFKKQPNKLLHFGFILIGSFLVYYFIFILFPAVGPQFHWRFPDNQMVSKGIFGNIVKFIQANGEAPTAAFPSSHVGVSIILLMWLFLKKSFPYYYLIPNVILLIFATVYIKAHYFVDVVAGIISAPAVYFFVNKSYFSLLKFTSKFSNNL